MAVTKCVLFTYSPYLSFRFLLKTIVMSATAYTGTKPQLNFWQIFNMCFGFFGIQFGWSLQMGNMSAIYEYLGASPDEIPGL